MLGRPVRGLCLRTGGVAFGWALQGGALLALRGGLSLPGRNLGHDLGHDLGHGLVLPVRQCLTCPTGWARDFP